MKYLPFLSGVYSTAPGLVPVSKQENDFDRLVFQTDELYPQYLANKISCRQEHLQKYYREHNYYASTRVAVNDYLLRRLVKEHPTYFDYAEMAEKSMLLNLKTGEMIRWETGSMNLIASPYQSLFDALCSQVQEDIAVCQLEETRDWLAAIHLCAPNHWAAGDKIGKPFDAIHAPVPGMEKTMPHYFKMLQTIVQKDQFTRFAWGIGTDNRLNHHPEAPAGMDADDWKGRKIDVSARLYIRTERQNLVGFSAANAFLFTIRTYFYEVDALENHEKKALWSAIRSMSPAALEYKGLTDVTDYLSKRLFIE